jgi:heterodisulfide reductase subunit B
MKYLYYPGCSLKGTGKAYEESLLAVFDKLGITVEELAGWNCCGATAYMSVDQNKAFALAARNLALAEQHNGNEPVNLIAPCNACYLVLSKTQKHIGEYQELGSAIIDALTAVGLTYRGNVRVRHPLDVLVNDFGLDKIVQCVDKPLNGLKVACYYGCQVVRPYAEFDENAGLELSRIILREARVRGADIIATACPLCQFNLECYQKKMSRTFGDAVDIPVVFFSQLMGTAFGLNARQIGMNRLLVPVNKVLAKA